MSGVKVLSVYDEGKKIKHLAYLDCQVTLEYDQGVPADAKERIAALFAQPEVVVEKKSKNGIKEENIIPMIRKMDVAVSDGHTLTLSALICCQNPTLNPMQLAAAIEKYLPDCKPDFLRCRRVEVYDTENKIFR